MSIPNHCCFCGSENIIYFGNSFSVKDADGDWFAIEEYLCEDCKETFFIG